jgi:hypothetical protein
MKDHLDDLDIFKVKAGKNMGRRYIGYQNNDDGRNYIAFIDDFPKIALALEKDDSKELLSLLPIAATKKRKTSKDLENTIFDLKKKLEELECKLEGLDEAFNELHNIYFDNLKVRH